MATLYLECNMGAAGDMLTASLLELLPEPNQFMEELLSLHLPQVKIERETAYTKGIEGTRIHVAIDGEEEISEDVLCFENQHSHHKKHHQHSSMAKIIHILEGLAVSDKVRADVLSVYHLIAAAESKVHGCTVEEIHFHEVGAMDALTDILAVCLLMDKIGAERIICSPIHVGSGMVRCAHGILPVPAPATLQLLKGIPCYGSEIKGELCTPTGAALLKHFVTEFAPLPIMNIEKIGIGIGTKEFPAANILRSFWGECQNTAKIPEEVSCDIDDSGGEALGKPL